jgi:alpha-beta hydrolase superfamily lysophospholipase
MTPVYVGGCYGVLHPADGRRGVVICGPLGDESLNTYRAQVFLAERLAEAGFPTLRISYYGTGDSRGEEDESSLFRAWIESITAAARWLRSTLGASSVTLCGLRIGAALAACAADESDDVESLILLAPIVNGRRFLREQVLTARTIADIWGSTDRIDDERWFEAYGLRIDRATRDALGSLDIGKLEHVSARRVLMLDQPDVRATRRLADAWRGKGLDVTYETGMFFDGLLRESHDARIPHEAFNPIVEWLGDAARTAAPNVSVLSNRLEMEMLYEQPVHLGIGGVLAGVLAVPRQRESRSPVVLIPSTGANPRYSTSRGAVVLARWLARQGIVSLRMDGHGIGDSSLATGERGVPYGRQGDRDVRAGVDFITDRFDGPVIVSGMCSGAYHAFQAALTDQRISGLILVNLQRFVWREGNSLAVVQRTTFRTTGFYLRNLASPLMWRRLARGQINVAGITATLARRAIRQLAAAADPAIAALQGETTVGMVRRQIAELSARRVQILYVLSGNDPGLDEIAEYFGFRGWRLRRNRMVMFHRLNGADHTLGARWARLRLERAVAVYLRQRFGLEFAVDAPEADGSEAGSSGAVTGSSAIALGSAPTAA